jgi:hypothetical protein
VATAAQHKEPSAPTSCPKNTPLKLNGKGTIGTTSAEVRHCCCSCPQLHRFDPSKPSSN